MSYNLHKFIDHSGPQTAANNEACWRQAQKDPLTRKRKPAEMEKESDAMEKARLEREVR